MLYDFLFELTEGSDNEGEMILCEAENLDAAWACLVFDNGFDRLFHFTEVSAGGFVFPWVRILFGQGFGRFAARQLDEKAQILLQPYRDNLVPEIVRLAALFIQPNV